jgi:hypothetical protein
MELLILDYDVAGEVICRQRRNSRIRIAMTFTTNPSDIDRATPWSWNDLNDLITYGFSLLCQRLWFLWSVRHDQWEHLKIDLRAMLFFYHLIFYKLSQLNFGLPIDTLLQLHLVFHIRVTSTDGAATASP